jgi:hypothetical protein
LRSICPGTSISFMPGCPASSCRTPEPAAAAAAAAFQPAAARAAGANSTINGVHHLFTAVSRVQGDCWSTGALRCIKHSPAALCCLKWKPMPADLQRQVTRHYSHCWHYRLVTRMQHQLHAATVQAPNSIFLITTELESEHSYPTCTHAMSCVSNGPTLSWSSRHFHAAVPAAPPATPSASLAFQAALARNPTAPPAAPKPAAAAAEMLRAGCHVVWLLLRPRLPMLLRACQACACLAQLRIRCLGNMLPLLYAQGSPALAD